MRGKPAATFSDSVAAGITPADAGKTFGNPTHPKPHKDHPRGCGENKTSILLGMPYSGSPPRMRGKHGNIALPTGGTGITPADAGKTAVNRHIQPSVGDHPRGCGENDTFS